MIYDKADEIIQNVFWSLLSRYKIVKFSWKHKLKEAILYFDCVNLFHYKYHKISLKLGCHINNLLLGWKTKKQQ